MEDILLEMRKISKRFPGVYALNNVDLKVKRGSVHALMGENGAGKSTLMKCLFGIYKKDEGNIFLNGQEVSIKDTKEALNLGISMVHQELQLIEERSIAENIFCGRYPMKKMAGISFVDHKKMFDECEKSLNEIDLHFHPKTKISELSVSQRQSIEIAKAISLHSKIIIMDEPTSSLTENEVHHLFKLIRQLKEKGTSIIYISHKMEEILQIADEVSVMRDGMSVGCFKASECDTDFIIRKMVGRELTQRFPIKETVPQEIILKVDNLTSSDSKSFQNVSFDLRRGEILGVGGLVGAKRSETMEGLFGIGKLLNKKIFYKDKELMIKNPKDAIEKGIALLTEDRRATGIFSVLSIEDNVGIASLNKYLRFKWMINQNKLEKMVAENISKMNIKAPSAKTLIQNLSGGNQQKVLLVRWLANNPDILILDEPTRGIDVGAKFEIYSIMIDLVKNGKSIIMISSEMSELLGMSDRIMVMCEGKVTGIVECKETTQEEIMKLATLRM